jgi:hypothetical protein
MTLRCKPCQYSLGPPPTTNKRTEAWWKLREALDPSRAGGSGIDLPDDQELLSDLTSGLTPTFGAPFWRRR